MRPLTTLASNIIHGKQRPLHVLALCVAVSLLSACRGPSVKPGINDPYKNADVNEWVKRFEGESREIYHNRERVAATVGLKPGMVVADIGAGTGFFTLMFADIVGPSGKVFAVDITPEFLELIRQRALDRKLSNIKTVRCAEDSVDLPPNSVDAVFICDVYHHFEYPSSTMASIHSALRSNGTLVVVDFNRIPGKSREWILGHIRAPRETVISEIEAAGFTLTPDQPNDDFLEENYILRFQKTE